MSRTVKLPLAILWIAVVMVAGIAIGYGISSSVMAEDIELVEADSEDLNAEVGDLQRRLEAVIEERDEFEAQVGTVRDQRDSLSERLAENEAVAEERVAGFDEREAALDERQAGLDERAAELDERENAITETEQQIEASKFGDGIYVVGEDIAAGEYRTDGADGSNPVGCYYAFLSSTGADADILDNNIVEGQTRVTLTDGDVFESSSCGEWTAVQ